MGCVEGVVFVTGERDERPVRGMAAFPGFFVGPELGGDDKDAMKGGGQDVGIGGHVEVVIDFIFPIEIGDALGDGMGGIDEINADFAFVPFGFLVGLGGVVPDPGAALDFFGPGMLIRADDGVMNDDEAAAALEEFFEGGALFADDFHPVGGVDDDDIGLGELLWGGEFEGAGGFDAAAGEELGPISEEPGVIMLVGAVGFDAGTDKDSERFCPESGCGQREKEQKMNERLHGAILGLFVAGSEVFFAGEG